MLNHLIGQVLNAQRALPVEDVMEQPIPHSKASIG